MQNGFTPACQRCFTVFLLRSVKHAVVFCIELTLIKAVDQGLIFEVDTEGFTDEAAEGDAGEDEAGNEVESQRHFLMNAW